MAHDGSAAMNARHNFDKAADPGRGAGKACRRGAPERRGVGRRRGPGACKCEEVPGAVVALDLSGGPERAEAVDGAEAALALNRAPIAVDALRLVRERLLLDVLRDVWE